MLLILSSVCILTFLRISVSQAGAHMKKITLILFLCFLFVPANAWPITFTNGFWSGGFEDCPSGTDCDIGPTHSCWDGLGPIWWGGVCGQDACGGTKMSEITPAAARSGKRGYRMWFGTDNWKLSDPLAAGFTPNSKEIWIRFYTKMPTNWDVGVAKHTYIFSDSGSECHFTSQITLGGDVRYEGVNCGGSFTQDNDLYTNDNVNAPCFPNCPVTGNQFDGQWHSWEFYYDKGTDTSNGVIRYWIDGILIYERTDYNFQPVRDGDWVQIQIFTNTGQRTQSVCTNVDLDDFAIANEDYAGFVQDAYGNKMIGPTGGVGGAARTLDNTAGGGGSGCFISTIVDGH
jgi:hypothetical protein